MMRDMERTLAKVDNDGQLILPPQVQSALGLSSGTEVEVVLHDRYIELREPRKPLSAEELERSLSELQGLFANGPSLEDDLYAMRREEEEHHRRKFGW
jgi:bifunctional DNA-binding transcriptional regulator/antitoxin component of YhaV-PrlF toxin-antitoxin module